MVRFPSLTEISEVKKRYAVTWTFENDKWKELVDNDLKIEVFRVRVLYLWAQREQEAEEVNIALVVEAPEVKLAPHEIQEEAQRDPMFRNAVDDALAATAQDKEFSTIFESPASVGYTERRRKG